LKSNVQRFFEIESQKQRKHLQTLAQVVKVFSDSNDLYPQADFLNTSSHMDAYVKCIIK